MSEAKHTPGPWQACKGGDCQCGMIWDATGNGLVAVAQGAREHLKEDGSGPDCVPTDEAQKANARLIAAAPKLLKALNQCLGILCESGNLNNYRNLSDEELGKAWIEAAKHAAEVLNEAEGRLLASTQRQD
jgi:hypothetical protein